MYSTRSFGSLRASRSPRRRVWPSASRWAARAARKTCCFRSSASAPRSRASPMHRCFCSGSALATSLPCCSWPPSRPFRSSSNTWAGVKAVKEIWVRSAQAMGADDRRLLHQVILPGALPYMLTGLRLGLAQAWRILVGVEMLAAVPWGLGWMIFGAREFLNTDVMLAGVAVIGAIGLALEKFVFQRLERYTVVRWGMMS
ncbi:MAG: ABC transporter permease subunit [Alphaproteobacteria bacterium]|nr:MAG: ABC transporter permease subunit [Alphaproteobacteria bacterium]